MEFVEAEQLSTPSQSPLAIMNLGAFRSLTIFNTPSSLCTPAPLPCSWDHMNAEQVSEFDSQYLFSLLHSGLKIWIQRRDGGMTNNFGLNT